MGLATVVFDIVSDEYAVCSELGTNADVARLVDSRGQPGTAPTPAHTHTARSSPRAFPQDTGQRIDQCFPPGVLTDEEMHAVAFHSFGVR